MIKIAVVLEPCEEGGFSVHVPTLPGCFGEGETEEQALDNIREAIELHLEAVEDDLIVDEDSKVIELTWTFPERGPVPSVRAASNSGGSRPLDFLPDDVDEGPSPR